VVHSDEGWTVDAALVAIAGVGLTGATATSSSSRGLYAVYSLVMLEADPFHNWLLVATAAVLVFAVVLAAAGVSVAVCLIVVMFAPVVTVVGFELVGHRHMAAAHERMR
jgi:hypothetical protein